MTLLDRLGQNRGHGGPRLSLGRSRWRLTSTERRPSPPPRETAPPGCRPKGWLPAGASTTSQGGTSPSANATPIDAASASARAPTWVMITRVVSAGRFLLIVKRVRPLLVRSTPPLIAVRSEIDAGVNQGCLQAFPGGRYWTTAGIPASRSFASSPDASSSELISTVT